VCQNSEISWEGFFNTRDLGGLPTLEGGVTRSRAFIRSADLRFVTSAGWREARAAGVRTIADLRNDDEVLAAGAEGQGSIPVGEGSDDIERLRIPLDDIQDTEFWTYVRREHLNGSPLYYQPFLDRKGDRCAAAFTAFAGAGPRGILFHCGVGRDRTGLVALLLLSLAKVDPEAIAEDHELSTHALRPFFAALGQPDQAPTIESMPAEHGSTIRSALHAVLDGFDAESYLLGAGVRQTDLDAVRGRLVAH
jgi:protein-tyrosine phosphatase